MEITYKDTKDFNADELKRLFSSVGWQSADYSKRLVKAFKNCGTVYSAWDGERLVGLINALDDEELTAYVHYVLVDREYQDMGIGSELVKKICERYKGFLYIVITPEHKEIEGFYGKFGFEKCGELCMAVSNYNNRD